MFYTNINTYIHVRVKREKMYMYALVGAAAGPKAWRDSKTLQTQWHAHMYIQICSNRENQLKNALFNHIKPINPC